MKLLYDVENSRWYNENGESFDSENPTIPYGNAERVEIQLYAEVEGTNSGSGAVADWTKYTDFTGSGYGAILATDNNFLHWFKATLQTAVPAGELPVSTVIDIATNVGIDDIAESGNIYLYDGNGGNEAVAYASREAISGGIRFTPAAGNVLENAYAAGAQTDIPEMLYAEAPMVPEASDPANGLFVFDFLCDSTKLRNKMQYSSVERVDDCKGLELTVFQTNADNTVSIRKRFRCSSFRITGGIADIKSGVPVPVPEQNQILALLHSFIAQGIEIQGSADGETWIDYAEIEDFQALRWFRIRVKGSNSNWSDAIPLLEGPKGNGLRVDAAGLLADISTYDTESAGFTYLATDTGDLYFKNSETSGDWADPVAFKGDPGESGVLENFVLPVTALVDGKIAIAADAAFPVAVKTAAGNIYPIEKGSLVAAQGGGYEISPDPYLAYDDSASFTGTWYVYCAGGMKGVMPVGLIFPYPSTQPPTGAFILNGQTISNCQALYPAFWEWLNTEVTASRVRAVTDSDYTSELSAKGNCGAFVIGAGGVTGAVRLPTITTGFIQGTDSNIGQTEEAGLPNITGVFSHSDAWNPPNTVASGAFQARQDGSSVPSGRTTSSGTGGVSLDASLSSAVYGKSNTVQPASVHYTWCIQVYHNSTSLSQQEADQLALEIQGKAGISLENLNAAGKMAIADNALELDYASMSTPSASVQYQASRAGLLVAYGVNNSGGPSIFYIQTAPASIVSGYDGYQSGGNLATGLSQSLCIFVPKGWYYQIAVNNTTITGAHFIPFQNSIAN